MDLSFLESPSFIFVAGIVYLITAPLNIMAMNMNNKKVSSEVEDFNIVAV